VRAPCAWRRRGFQGVPRGTRSEGSLDLADAYHCPTTRPEAQRSVIETGHGTRDQWCWSATLASRATHLFTAPKMVLAVGTVITDRPPHRSGRAQLRHPAPTRGIWRQATTLRPVARGPAPVTRFPGSVPGTCFAVSRSSRSPPFAPPAPLPVARLCSLVSLLLRR